jgi:hypothetical protein
MIAAKGQQCYGELDAAWATFVIGLEVCICEDEGSVPALRRGDRWRGETRRPRHPLVLFPIFWNKFVPGGKREMVWRPG